MPCIRHSQAHATTKHETCPITDTPIPSTVVAFQNCEFRYTTVRYNGFQFSVFKSFRVVTPPFRFDDKFRIIYHRIPKKTNRNRQCSAVRGPASKFAPPLSKTKDVRSFPFIRGGNENLPRFPRGSTKKRIFRRFGAKSVEKRIKWDLQDLWDVQAGGAYENSPPLGEFFGRQSFEQFFQSVAAIPQRRFKSSKFVRGVVV